MEIKFSIISKNLRNYGKKKIQNSKNLRKKGKKKFQEFPKT